MSETKRSKVVLFRKDIDCDTYKPAKLGMARSNDIDFVVNLLIDINMEERGLLNAN